MQSSGLFLLVLIASFFFACSDKQAPNASFELSNNSCFVPCNPGIVNQSTGADTYQWSFGDGVTSTEAEPTHIYTSPGIYTLTLTVTNGDGVSTFTETVTILPNCTGTACGAHGTCVNGSCVCEPHWEGTLCDTASTTKFLGNYSEVDTCGASVYQVIGPVTVVHLAEGRVRINEFGGFSGANFIEADVVRETPDAPTAQVLVIDFTDQNNRHFSGSGKLTGNVILGNYTVTYSNGDVDSCIFRMTKN